MSQAGDLSATAGPVPPDVPTSFVANTGVAVPALNVLNDLGTGSITTTGSGNTITTSLTGLTNHAVLVGAGTATITKLAVGATGLVLTGNTSADPAFAAIGTNSALLSHGVIIGQGNAPFVTSNAGTNGQVLMGGTGLDPQFVSITAGTNITVTPGSLSLTISASQTPLINNYTAVATSPYVVTATDYYISVDTSSARTIQLPNSPTTFRTFIIKDRTGSAAANNITVTTVGGAVLIDGSTSQLINQNYGSINILWNSTSYEVY